MVHLDSIVLSAVVGLLGWSSGVAQDWTTPRPPWLAAPFERELSVDDRLSTCRQGVDFLTGLGLAEARRVFAVGNGQVFAGVELGSSAASTPGVRCLGTGDWTLGLAVLSSTRGRLEFPAQRILRVRRASCVLTETTSEHTVLRTATFAPAGTRTILRLVEVAALSRVEALSGVEAPSGVEALSGTETLPGAEPLSRPGLGESSETFSLVATLARRSTSALDRITLKLGSLAAGTRWRGCLGIEIPRADLGRVRLVTRPVRNTIESVRTHLDPAEELRTPTHYTTDHGVLADLLDSTAIDLQALRHVDSGLLVSNTGSDSMAIEDGVGLMLVQLRFGLRRDAAQFLRAVFQQTCDQKQVPRTLSRDRRSDDTTGIDWRGVEVYRGESPLWIVLAHYWYWRATRDAELISRHWPLLEVCLKQVDREPGDLVRLATGEPWLVSAQARDVARHGGYSFRAGSLLVVAIQAFGELAACCAEVEARTRIERRFRNRMFRAMQNVESHYWLEDEGCFAPALRSDTTPVAAFWPRASLFPSLIGWTFASDNRHARNVDRWLASSGPSHPSTRDRRFVAAQLAALADRDDARTRTAVDRAIGDFATGDVLSMGSRRGGSGYLIDALLFALTGIRQASVPDHDKDEIRLRPRLPGGATRFGAHRHQKDGRTLSMHFDERLHWLSLGEEVVERDLPIDRRHDPRRHHRRLHIRVELHDGAGVDGRPFEVALKTDERLLLRWLSMEHGDAHRRIEESAYLTVDR